MDNNNNNQETNSNTNGFCINNALFIMQSMVTVFGLAFSSSMLYMGQPVEVYLPILTSIVGWWMPSPMNNKMPSSSSSNIQVRQIFRRGIHPDINHV